jgi:hypothetical protein
LPAGLLLAFAELQSASAQSQQPLEPVVVAPPASRGNTSPANRGSQGKP